MDVLEPDEEANGRSLMSFEVYYLILSDFRQKKNKKGESYGWHIAVVETPETKWGRSFVASEYSDDPEVSWNKIQARVSEHFPEAEEKDIRKVLGIRKL